MKSRSLKINAFLNGFKQIMSIAYPLITFPYIAHSLGNESFGIYSFSLSIATYFMLFAALGIKNYAIREGAKLRDDKKKLSLFCSQLYTIGIICSVISFFTLLVFLLCFKSKFQEYSSAIIVLSLAMFIDAFGADWVNSIFEDYLYIAIRYIVFQLFSIILMFLFVKTPKDIIAYCVISLIASHGGNLINVFYLKKYVRLGFVRNLEIKNHLKPLLIFFANIITITIYVTADITMLGFFFDDKTVGIYGFVTRIYTLLKNIVYAIVLVSIPRLSYSMKNNREKVRSIYNEVFDLLTLFVLPIAVGLFSLSKQTILIVGGEEYIEGTRSLMILSIAIIFGIYSSFYSDCVLVVNGFEKRCLIATTLTAGINVLLNLFFVPLGRLEGAAITTLAAEFINYYLQRLFSKRVSNVGTGSKKNFYSCVLGSVFIFIFSWFVIRKVANILIFVVLLLICIICYFLICYSFNNTIMISIISNISNKFKKINNR